MKGETITNSYFSVMNDNAEFIAADDVDCSEATYHVEHWSGVWGVDCIIGGTNCHVFTGCTTEEEEEEEDKEIYIASK
ncbi:MAG: hypothetical protein LAT84_04865 [Balneolia bacterium]|nr:hypothetical protein [Balneolia bacterium]